MNSAELRTFLRRAEAMAVSGAAAHWARIPPELAKKIRPRVVSIADGFATLLPTSDALRMNRVVGLGHRGQVSERTIDEIIELYRSARLKRFSILLCPGPQFGEITSWLEARRFRPAPGHALLARDGARPVPRAETSLRVVRARRQDALAMVEIFERVFGIPVSRRAWSLATALAPSHEHFIAWAGNQPVSAAALRIEKDLAWFGGAGTLTRWRRRGAQSALIAARLRSVARAECRWSWVETAAEQHGRPGGSRRNLLAMGFEEVCVKPSWVYQFR